MRLDEFKRILDVFADPTSEFITEDNEFMVEINGQTVGGILKATCGEISVSDVDADNYIPATQWIIHRVAKLDLLAARLIDKLSGVDNVDEFISPELELSTSLEQESGEIESIESGAVDKIVELVEQESSFSTDVFYLVSDAGEGKTTLINEVSKRQAYRFKAGESQKLIVPIFLGGRTFLRFDDITVGVLQNRYRFSYLHYSAFIELIRLGVIIPAFDGFEEMFVETSTGEANSALGNLLNSLTSEGTLIIATRKAYFDFHEVKNQEKLFDAIAGYSVEFKKIEIRRWDKKQFLEYCDKCCVSDAKELYSEISNKIGERHSLLTRPVLVKQLMKVVQETASISELLEKVYSSGDSYFSTFVRAIVEREVTEKWLDRSGGDVASPLLSIEEHCGLLSEIAVEMWNSKIAYIKHDMLEFTVDYFCECRQKTPPITSQVKKRINNHALLSASDNASNTVEFDHDEFYQYFLGEAVASRLLSSSNNLDNTLTLLQKGELTSQAKSICALAIARADDGGKVVQRLKDVIGLDSRASFVHANATHILLSILNTTENNKPLTIEGMSFAASSTEHLTLSRVSFKDCYFERLCITDAKLVECSFENSRFSRIDLSSKSKVTGCLFSKNNIIDSIYLDDQDTHVYTPEMINQIVMSCFGTEQDSPVVKDVVSYVEDLEIKLIKKLLMYFLRSTHIGESIIRMKMGIHAHHFTTDVLPYLLESRVFREIDDHGSSGDRRFRLNVSLETMHSLIDRSHGSYNEFIDRVDKIKN
ncbi:MAG: hypothetical protein V5783_01600 [Pontiella sp.]